MRLCILLLLFAALPACVWVKPTGGGSAVRVAYDGNVGGCRDAGMITVSVQDHIAFYRRPELKVRDELETLARNQAATLPADTIRATGEPRDGEQSFAAYICGGTRVQPRETVQPHDAAQTYPIKNR